MVTDRVVLSGLLLVWIALSPPTGSLKTNGPFFRFSRSAMGFSPEIAGIQAPVRAKTLLPAESPPVASRQEHPPPWKRMAAYITGSINPTGHYSCLWSFSGNRRRREFFPHGQRRRTRGLSRRAASHGRVANMRLVRSRRRPSFADGGQTDPVMVSTTKWSGEIPCNPDDHRRISQLPPRFWGRFSTPARFVCVRLGVPTVIVARRLWRLYGSKQTLEV